MPEREAERRLPLQKLGHSARVCCASSFIVTYIQVRVRVGVGVGDKVGASARGRARVRVRVWVVLARQLEVLDAVEDEDLVVGLWLA